MNDSNDPSESDQHPLGLIKTQFLTCAYPPDTLSLRCKKRIGPVTIAYETYGKLNSDKSNAILIAHALSGNAHAAGFHSTHDRYPGWWDHYIGPGKPFDTDKYFMICSNVLGGCDGTTGPSSINPETGRPYGLGFPLVTIQDMVMTQKLLIDYLGIKKILSIAGGSMGGMQALSWAIMYPDMVNSVIAIASSASLSAQGIALNEVGRQSIMNDPNWNHGNYYESTPPDAGLSLARMIGHITYLSEQNMHERFGRKKDNTDGFDYDFETEFMVESYLHNQGIKFVDRFDANTYLYITRAIDYFDLKADYATLANAFEHVMSNFLIVSFSSDWLYPSSQSKEIVQALRVNGKNVIYTEIETDKGHDAFLIENRLLEKYITNFINHEFLKVTQILQ